jgi:hypothetical protein
MKVTIDSVVAAREIRPLRIAMGMLRREAGDYSAILLSNTTGQSVYGD